MWWLKSVTTVVVLVLLALGIGLGFKLGVNSKAKADTTISIDLLTQIHQRIVSGNIASARNLTEIGLLGNLSEYESLKKDLLAKIVYGTNITDLGKVNKHFREAMVIRKEALTNLVWFNSIGPTNSSSKKRP